MGPSLISVSFVAFVGGIGATELIIILLVALVVLGPAKLPDVARSIGKGMRELRRASDDIRDEFYGEIRDVQETVKETVRAAEGHAPDDPARPAEEATGADDGTPPPAEDSASDSENELPDQPEAADARAPQLDELVETVSKR